MQIDAQTADFIEIQSVSQLRQLIQEKRLLQPVYILGGGSNVVFVKDWEGTVLLMNNTGIEVVGGSEKDVLIKAGAGENWHDFVLWTLAQDFGGLENLSLIPGKVGASPMQNIGAYGVEIKDVFVELEAVEVSTGNLKKFNHQECKFGYRESVFKNELKSQFIIVSVTFKLTKIKHQIHTEYGAISQQLSQMGVENPAIQDVARAVIAIRQSKLPDPELIPNCGSFFKNPTVTKEEFLLLKKEYPEIPGYPVGQGQTKVPAGWLIEKSGWKGYRNQTVGVHEKQALVIINHNQGSGHDVYELSQEILQDVFSKFGIKLEREVNII